MELAFTKMHGLGNDFIVFDFIDEPHHLSKAQIKCLSDRNFGIGCDQLLILESSQHEDADVRYRIFNADGDEVEQCGNGARCIARYLIEKRGYKQDSICAETAKGLIFLYCDDELIRVNMGSPNLEPASLPMQVDEVTSTYHIDIDGNDWNFMPVSMGNPHAVFICNDVASLDLERLGPVVQNCGLFPESVNVGFLQIIDAGHGVLRVYERGVGETLACGTGACAAVVAGREQNLLNDEVQLLLNGGPLKIFWAGNDRPVWMTGSATSVFTGTIEL